MWIERYDVGDVELLSQARAAATRGATVLVSELTRVGIDRRVVCDSGQDGELDTLLRTRRDQQPPRLRRSSRGGTELLERVDDVWLPLRLYGAGNVGQALVRILSQLPVRVTWVDSRPGLFPSPNDESVHRWATPDPVATVATAAPGTWFAIMTHSHALDYSLCRAILARGDFAWAGLIGSKSKAARFRSRLARHGIDAERIARLVCPIGVRGIQSKWPAAIAVAIAAQLLQVLGGEPGGDGRIELPSSETETCEGGDCGSCGKPRTC